MCPAWSQWVQNLFPAFRVFQQWGTRAVSSEKSLACLCHRPQSAGGAASPCSGEKPALVGCAVEKVHVSIACFLTSEGFIVTSESMGSFSHSLEQYSSKVRKSFYSTALDKVGFFKCDTATAGLPQAVQRACRWVPNSPACFCCALND